MNVEKDKDTILWDLYDGIFDRRAAGRVATDSVNIVFGWEADEKLFDAVANAANEIKRVRVAVPARLEMCRWLGKFKTLHGVFVSGTCSDVILSGLKAPEPPCVLELPTTIRQLEVRVDGPAGKVAASLSRFSKLESLSLSGKLDGIEDLLSLNRLEELALYYVANIEWKQLASFRRLRRLRIQHGSVTGYPADGSFAKLEALAIWRTKGIESVDWLATLTNLKQLELGALPRVSRLPSLAACKKLTSVVLDQMKGLKNLEPVAMAPNLRTIDVRETKQIPVEEYEAFKGHKKLRELSSGYRSRKKDNAINEMLGIPRVNYDGDEDMDEF